jgi:hypothetical protein
MTAKGKNLGRNTLIFKRFSGVLVIVLNALGAGDSEVSARNGWRRYGLWQGRLDVTE